MMFSLNIAERIFQFAQYSTAPRYTSSKLHALQNFASTYTAAAKGALTMFAVQTIPIF